MRVEEIEKLLAAYYEGTTSEMEEETLKDYFRTTEVPVHLQRDKEMFLGFRRTACPEVPSALEEKLTRLIDARSEREKRIARWRISRYWASGIAACLLLSIGLGYVAWEDWSNSRQPKDTFTNPREAHAMLQATLLEMSAGLNDGLEEMTEIKEEIRETNKQIIQDIQ